MTYRFFVTHRYFELRERLDSIKTLCFFVTNRGDKVSKVYEDAKRACSINISTALFRRMVETKGITQDTAIAGDEAVALCHSSDVADRHYRLPNAETAIRRNNVIRQVDDTAIVDEFIRKKWVTTHVISCTRYKFKFLILFLQLRWLLF